MKKCIDAFFLSSCDRCARKKSFVSDIYTSGDSAFQTVIHKKFEAV